MKLSIIIVNYNVKFFLEQCIASVIKAISTIEAEIWVVDNASTDGSLQYLQPLYPTVNFIANPVNEGFAKANNRALLLSKGDYILFLNPDTILPEDCLTNCIEFISSREKAGALGIRMIDGRGTFLPESKRSFPSPLTSFYKLAGLSKLFPKSKIFSKYALAYLSEFENHEVDVLSGAFILTRKHLVTDLKGFDESFFMYGEDIDLSYRIQKAGYKNYYFSESTIIHFKGESTRKGSINYVKMFYNAMSIFVEKHYKGPSAKILVLFLKTAIWLRAGISAAIQFLLKIGMPLIDTVLIFSAFLLIEQYWVNYVRDGHPFITELVQALLPAYTLVFLGTATIAGIYDRKYKPFKAVCAAVAAIIVTVAAYSLLAEEYRFSRGVILFGGITATIFITCFRYLLLKFNVVEDDDELNKKQKTIIVGTEEEYVKIRSLFKKAGILNRVLGRVAVEGQSKKVIGTTADLNEIVRSLQLKEIVFCEGYLTYKCIIDLVQKIPTKLSVRFHSKGSKSIVGSDSKDTSGESVSVFGSFNINEAYQKRMKRIIDITVSLFILFTFPAHILLLGFKAIINSAKVLFAKKTWVGYRNNHNDLPLLRESVLIVNQPDKEVKKKANKESTFNADYWYAKNYDWKQDLKIIASNYKKLGGQ